ncbi:MAG: hypothetical protein U0X39_12895 [Bacteroidales bacterium]
MRKQVGLVLFVAVMAGLFSGCSKNGNYPESASLKLAINQGALELNTAVSKISSSQTFSVLTADAGTLKSATISDSTYRVYIPLEKISGVYEYKPKAVYDRWGLSLIRFFNRTADNSHMIVKMPLRKVKSPRTVSHYSPADTTLENNFMIDVSDYHNNYNSYHDYDYILDSKITIDDTEAGSLYIKSNVSPENGTDYTSNYTFTGSYKAEYKYLSGDTTVSSFSILDGTKTLYEEKRLTFKSDSSKFGREHIYILTIGDVTITRNHSDHTVQVAVNGVVQPGATVTVVDREDDEEASVCKKREVQITFEDGTTATISELISSSVDNIRTIFQSLHQVYFAAYVVDWIAYDIYYERN